MMIPAPGHITIIRWPGGDHCSVQELLTSLLWPDLSSRSWFSWSRFWYISLADILPGILLSSVLVSSVLVSLYLITIIIVSSVLAIVRYSLSLPYLHPISPNNGKCVSCRVASSDCPCVFSYSVNVGQTAFPANTSPWNSVTFELPRYLIPSSLSVLFVLRPQNANDIRYNCWSICIESEW